MIPPTVAVLAITSWLPQAPEAAPSPDPITQHTVFSLRGLTELEQFGTSVAPAGDVDRDGVPDILVGSLGAWSQGGTVSLFSGSTGRLLHQWVSSDPGSDLFGSVLCGGADVDGDGVPDVVAGAPSYGGGDGRIVVYSGRTGLVLTVVMGSAGEALGSAIVNVGDLDGDGHDDLAVAAPGSALGAGRIDVLSGRWLTDRSGAQYLQRIWGWSRGSYLGSALAARDLDGDGRPELVATAPWESTSGTAAGAIHVISTLTGQVLWSFYGSAQQTLGLSVCVPGDLDGDGHPDIVAGAPSATSGSTHTGMVCAYSFHARTRLYVLYGQGDLSIGCSVSGIGDVDGDGCDDLLIGAVDDWEPRRMHGKAMIVSGQSGQTLREFVGATLGRSVAGLGDVNGDGVPDFAAGAPYEPWTSPGSALILSAAPLTLTANALTLSATAGGRQDFKVAAGPAHAHRWYWLLGSASGTWPGVNLPGFRLPLNADFYFQHCLGANASPLVNSIGRLDAGGSATAAFVLPPGLPGLANLSLHHACVVCDPTVLQVTLTSNAVPVDLVQ